MLYKTVSTLAVTNIIFLLAFLAERGKSVSLLKDSSKRKRKKNELDEVREEE